MKLSLYRQICFLQWRKHWRKLNEKVRMKRVKQLKVELLETDLIACQLYTAIN